MPMPLLGVVVTELPAKMPSEAPFAHSFAFQELCLSGLRAGIEVFVFSPNRIDWSDKRITGYTYHDHHKKWMKKSYPIPDLIYDRCFFASRAAYLDYRSFVQKIHADANVPFLGHQLGDKWKVGQILRRDSFFEPYLPDTCLLSHVREVLHWLDVQGELILKPLGGSQGRGVLHIKHTPLNQKSYFLSGRNKWNRPFRISLKGSADLKIWLNQFLGPRPYLMQQYLSLQTIAGHAYDIRSMVQKNGHGRWELTGMGIRCGQPGSITANLHGGGSASEVFPFLAHEFSSGQAEELMHTASELSARIPPVLEAAYGRLCELGIDFGIDLHGHMWILEVNSKPGRTIFNYLPNETARNNSKENPIRYAAYLLRAQSISRSPTAARSSLTGVESP